MNDLDPDIVKAYEPEPTIVIRCQRVPIPGQLGSYRLAPVLSFTNMPGGWQTCFDQLQACMTLVVSKLVEEAQGQVQAPMIHVPSMVLPEVKH